MRVKPEFGWTVSGSEFRNDDPRFDNVSAPTEGQIAQLYSQEGKPRFLTSSTRARIGSLRKRQIIRVREAK